jgi:thiosulfate dehydrogenase [quinone] large subunit
MRGLKPREVTQMTDTNSGTEKTVLVLLRLCMAWTFLYAASHQVFVPGWSATGFLAHTKTFNWLFLPLTGPAIGPVVSFLVEYGHLAIGLSLLLGVFSRASATAGIVLMILYWMAHMDFPFISDKNNFLIDSHIVYALVLWLGIVKQSGRIWGLDGRVSELSSVSGNRLLAWAAS